MATMEELYRQYMLGQSSTGLLGAAVNSPGFTPVNYPTLDLFSQPPVPLAAPAPASGGTAVTTRPSPLGTYGGATMNDPYQQYLLTQPGVGGSQNRYRDLMSQTKPFVSPYPASRGLLAGAAVKPPSTTTGSSMGTYGGGLGGTTVDGVDQNLSTANPSWDALTDAERASFYANNPGFAKATQIGQNVFSNLTKLGKVQSLLDPERVTREGLIAKGVDPKAFQASIVAMQKALDDDAAALRAITEAKAIATNVPTEQESKNAFDAYMNANATNVPTEQEAKNAFEAYMAPPTMTMSERMPGGFATQVSQYTPQQLQTLIDLGNYSALGQARSMQQTGIYGAASLAEQQAINDALSRVDAQAAAQQQAADNAAAEAAIGSYGGGSFAEQQAMNDAISAAQAQSISDQSGANSGGYDTGYGTGDTSGGFGEGQYAKGGKVIKAHLKGPDPKGPDEGYGALLGGEFVIQKSAVKKYGEGLLSMINDGKIPAKKLKSLL
jgi:hypothetical protein